MNQCWMRQMTYFIISQVEALIRYMQIASQPNHISLDKFQCCVSATWLSVHWLTSQIIPFSLSDVQVLNLKEIRNEERTSDMFRLRTIWAEPVALRDYHDNGAETEHVKPSVALITQEHFLLSITPTALLTKSTLVLILLCLSFFSPWGQLGLNNRNCRLSGFVFVFNWAWFGWACAWSTLLKGGKAAIVPPISADNHSLHSFASAAFASFHSFLIWGQPPLDQCLHALFEIAVMSA